MVTLTVLYLAAGVWLTRSWPRFAESGKTFLVLVFPAHVVLYLLLAQFSAQQLRDGLRNFILLMLWLYWLAWLTR